MIGEAIVNPEVRRIAVYSFDVPAVYPGDTFDGISIQYMDMYTKQFALQFHYDISAFVVADNN